MEMSFGLVPPHQLLYLLLIPFQITDGTAAGTRMHVDLNPGPGDSRISKIVRISGSLAVVAFYKPSIGRYSFYYTSGDLALDCTNWLKTLLDTRSCFFQIMELIFLLSLLPSAIPGTLFSTQRHMLYALESSISLTLRKSLVSSFPFCSASYRSNSLFAGAGMFAATPSNVSLSVADYSMYYNSTLIPTWYYCYHDTYLMYRVEFGQKQYIFNKTHHYNPSGSFSSGLLEPGYIEFKGDLYLVGYTLLRWNWTTGITYGLLNFPFTTGAVRFPTIIGTDMYLLATNLSQSTWFLMKFNGTVVTKLDHPNGPSVSFGVGLSQRPSNILGHANPTGLTYVGYMVGLVKYVLRIKTSPS